MQEVIKLSFVLKNISFWFFFRREFHIHTQKHNYTTNHRFIFYFRWLQFTICIKTGKLAHTIFGRMISFGWNMTVKEWKETTLLFEISLWSSSRKNREYRHEMHVPSNRQNLWNNRALFWVYVLFIDMKFIYTLRNFLLLVPVIIISNFQVIKLNSVHRQK